MKILAKHNLKISVACDSDIDRDRDGIQDSQDNCPKVCVDLKVQHLSR